MGLATVEGLWTARQELAKAGNGQKPALWRVISGLDVGKEDELSPGERAAGLRKLAATFLRVLKAEFKAERAGVQARQAGAEEDDEAGELLTLQSPCWNPVAQVCTYLSIAESALSRLVSEVSGYSAQQLADRERLRALRPVLKAELEAFVRERVGSLRKMAADLRSTKAEGMQWSLFKLWKKHKRGRWELSPAARAVRFGFKYAARYRQACLLEFGVTPEALEFEALKEIAEYFAACEGLSVRVTAIEDPCHTYQLEYANKPYRDLWAKFWVEKKEWLLAMKEQWGLSVWNAAACEKHVDQV